jgi:hypothetical protein
MYTNFSSTKKVCIYLAKKEYKIVNFRFLRLLTPYFPWITTPTNFLEYKRMSRGRGDESIFRASLCWKNFARVCKPLSSVHKIFPSIMETLVSSHFLSFILS